MEGKDLYAHINGTRIFFDIDGKEWVPAEDNDFVLRQKPVCFVLHGGPGSDHTSYLPALDPLTRFMQLVYVDYRGNGRSGFSDEQTWTIAQNVEDIEALRRYLGFEKIVIFGQSYGGIVAQSYGIRYTENLAALILVTTAASHSAFDRAREELKRRGNGAQIAIAEKYLWDGRFPDNETYLDYYRLFADLYTGSPESARLFAGYAAREILSYRALNRAFGGDLKTFDFLPDLSRIICPALLIGGRHDWITPVSCTLEIAERLADCKTVIMEESSHSVFSDQYDETLAEIIAFVRERLASSPEPVVRPS
ncbi:MAG: alpha/beta fold hydrolase [Spirochaetaceae bacterium]|nr:alpha/beta fold hydrolase [Spirochaetaceae bacterium]